MKTENGKYERLNTVKIKKSVLQKMKEGNTVWLYADQVFDSMRYIETPRLILRRMNMRDAEDLFEYSRDPEVARYVLWQAHKTIRETRSYIRYSIRHYHTGEPASLAIEIRETGKVIGTIGFMWYNEDSRSAEVGYSLSREYWNQGIMTEALSAILEHAFVKLKINRIEAQHELENPASGRVMEKVGMQKEGTLRQRLYNKGHFADVNLYAILRKDYLSMHGIKDTESAGGQKNH